MKVSLTQLRKLKDSQYLMRLESDFNCSGEVVEYRPRQAYTCREIMINDMARFLTDRSYGEHAIPDFSKERSRIIFAFRYEDDMEDIKTIFKSIACMSIYPIFGEEAFDISLSIDSYPWGTYHGPGNRTCLIVEFPTNFLSSKASMGIWLCYIRKAFAVVRAKDVRGIRKTAYEEVLPQLKEIKGFDDFTKRMIISMSSLSRDPFKRGSRNRGAAINHFRYEFMEFMIEMLEYPGFPNIFNPESWFCMTYSVNGFHRAISVLYGVDSVRDSFNKYLLENNICSQKEIDDTRRREQSLGFSP
jgi:hypothetical protein